MKKCLSVILTVVMLIAMIPTTVLPTLSFAANVASGDWHSEEYEGDPYSPTEIRTTGSGTWTLDDEGTLTVRGSGEMAYHYYENHWGDYSTVGSFPWTPWTSCTYINQIQNVVIESGITSIGGEIFGDLMEYSYYYLESVTIPASVTSIAADAFYNYSEDEGQTTRSIIIYCYKDSYAQTYAEKNGIPYAFLDGTDEENTVTGRAGRLLWSVNKLTGVLTITGTGVMPPFTTSRPTWEPYYPFIKEVVIGEGVTSVSDLAFSQSTRTGGGESSFTDTYIDNKSKITSVQLPSTLTEIGQGAFYGLTTLQSIDIPAGVTSVGEGAFSCCYNLRSVSLPEGLTEIKSAAFYRCSSLAGIDIPAGVKTIGSSAFYNCALTEMLLPDALTSIGYQAFCDCDGLTGVDVPANVTSISSYAFNGCDSLQNVHFFNEKTCYVGDRAFAYCGNLNEVHFSDVGTTQIGYRSFQHCENLTDVSFGRTTSIGTEAFGTCSSLKKIELPGTLRNVDARAFAFCNNDDDSYISFPNETTSLTYSTDYVDYEGYRIQNMITPANMVIHGFAGSTAEVYADTFNLMFEPIVCPNGGEHSWVVANPPQCGVTAICTIACEHCHYSYEKYVTAAHSNHKFVFIPDATDATCGYNGSGTYACEYCDYTYTDEGTLEHDYNKTYPNGVSCESFRDVIYTCTRCGDTYEVYEFVDHDWDVQTVWDEMDCTRTYTCRRCGESHSYYFGEMHGGEWEDPHNYVRKLIKEAVKCGERDFVKYTCSVCGHFYTQWETSNSVHSSHKYALQEPPVGTVCGERYTATFVCEYCGDTYTEEQTLEHKYLESKVECETICDVTYTCKYCGDSYTEENKFVDHNWEIERGYVDPSFTDADSEMYAVYTCRRCGETHTYYYNEWSCMDGHSFTRKVIKTADKCGGQDFVKYTCRVCGYSYTQWVTSSSVHSEHQYALQEPPVGTLCGERYTATLICEYCGDTYTEERTLDHKYEESGAVCETFCDVTYTCQYCGDSYTEENKFVDHDWDVVTINNYEYSYTDAETDYTKTYTCRRCGETHTYNYNEWSCDGEHSYQRKVIKGKCGEECFVKYTCSVCGNSYTTWQEPLYAEHEYEQTVIQEGDEENPKIVQYTCVHCGDSYTREIPPTQEYEIHVGETVNIYVPAGETVYLRFVPETSGYYIFRSHADRDTYGYLYNADREMIDSNDWGGEDDEGYNFRLQDYLNEGETYYFGARYDSSTADGFFDVSLQEYIPPHEHEYSYRTQREYTGTCTYEEYYVCYCELCGEELWQEYNGSGSEHSYIGETIRDNSCYEDGLIRYTCEKCGESYDEYIPAAHSFEDTWYSPSCTMMGFTRRVCTACGDEEIVDVTNATGHRDVDFDGFCDICGANLNGGDVPAHTEHTYGPWRTLITASCAGKGAEIRSCSCGAFETRETEALGHADDDGDGVCDVCLCVISLPAPEEHTEHSFGEWKTVSAAACAAPGYEIRICACGEFETRQTEAPGHLDADQDGVCDNCLAVIALPVIPEPEAHTTHTFGDWTVLTVPTCTAAGVEIRTCTGCGVFETKQNEAAGHKDDDENGVCDLCEAVLRLPEPEAHTEHTFGEWQTVSVATCAAAGVEIRVCTGCGSFETRSTAVQGHVDADRNGVCDVCKAVIALPDQTGSGDVTPHTAHTYGDWTRIANPSCVTAGTEIRVCTGCSSFEVREVSAVGHLDDNGDGLCDRCKTALTVNGGGNSDGQQDGNGGQRRSFFDRIVEFFRKIGDFFRNLFRIR